LKTEQWVWAGQTETDLAGSLAEQRFERARQRHPLLRRLRSVLGYALFWETVIVLVMGSALGLLFWLAVR
jgi:hypothetical protein